MLLIHHTIDMKITAFGIKIVISFLWFRSVEGEDWIWKQMQLHSDSFFFFKLLVEVGRLLRDLFGVFSTSPCCEGKCWTSVDNRLILVALLKHRFSLNIDKDTLKIKLFHQEMVLHCACVDFYQKLVVVLNKWKCCVFLHYTVIVCDLPGINWSDLRLIFM